MANPRIDLVETAKLGALAGTAGGFAEVLWISFYAAATGADAGEVARGVTAALRLPISATAVETGIAVHMALALALGVMVAFAWTAFQARLGRSLGVVGRYGILIGALAIVWMVNFLIVLPWISPAFVTIVPYSVSLASKLLFGVGAAAVLQLPRRSR